jgi:hypothetical protein
MRLKLTFQPLVQLRQLLLPFCFDFLPQLALNLPAFLKITRLELVPRISIQTKTRLLERRISLHSHLLPALHFAFPECLLLLWRHLQPTLGVALKCLPLFRRHLEKTLASRGPGLKMVRLASKCMEAARLLPALRNDRTGSD